MKPGQRSRLRARKAALAAFFAEHPLSLMTRRSKVAVLSV